MRLRLLPAVLLLALLSAPSGAHPAALCAPPTPFPSAAAWIVPPGDALLYFVPAEHAIFVHAPTPIDVTLAPSATCEADPACHHHGASGLVTCVARERAGVEIRNAGDKDTVVSLAIGPCKYAATTCEPAGTSRAHPYP